MGQPGLCVCPTDCIVEAQDVVITDSEGKKVCGTDGQTYPSECHMKIAACKKYQYIVVANKGDCGKHLTFSSLQYLDIDSKTLSTHCLSRYLDGKKTSHV